MGPNFCALTNALYLCITISPPTIPVKLRKFNSMQFDLFHEISYQTGGVFFLKGIFYLEDEVQKWESLKEEDLTQMC